MLLDLSTEGALEPGVAGSFVVRVVRGRGAHRHVGSGVWGIWDGGVMTPIEVESATWSAANDLDYPVKERQEWWGRYGVQTDIRCGSALLIYVRPRARIAVSCVVIRRFRF